MINLNKREIGAAVAQLFYTEKVGGSKPSFPTKQINRIMKFDDFVKPYLENLQTPDLQESVEFADKATQNIFASMWADWVEENAKHSEKYRHLLQGKDVLEIAPSYEEFMKPREKRQLEDKIYGFIASFEEANNNADVLDLYKHALVVDGQSLDNPSTGSTPEMFGFYIIMKMLGHGVAWEDDHKEAGFKYPHVEVSYLEFPDSFHEIEPDEDDEDLEDDDDISEWEREGEGWKGDDFNPNSGDEWKKG